MINLNVKNNNSKIEFAKIKEVNVKYSLKNNGHYVIGEKKVILRSNLTYKWYILSIYTRLIYTFSINWG